MADQTYALAQDGVYAQSSGVFVDSVIPDSGVARWEFEQDVTDSWYSNDGTDNTSAGYTTDATQGSYAKSFDGVDDDVVFDHDLSLTTYSAAVWIKTSVAQVQPFISRRDVDGGPTKNYGIMSNSDGAPAANHYDVDNSTWQRTDATTNIADGSWHHLVATYDGSDIVIYVDGNSEGSTAAGTPYTDSTQATRLGYEAGITNEYFEGDADDSRLYDKALTDTEVSNLYNTGSISG